MDWMDGFMTKISLFIVIFVLFSMPFRALAEVPDDDRLVDPMPAKRVVIVVDVKCDKECAITYEEIKNGNY